jgi:hypothetical protein
VVKVGVVVDVVSTGLTKTSELVVEVIKGIVGVVVEDVTKGGAEVDDDKTVEGDGFTTKVVLVTVVVGRFKVDVVVGGSGSVVVVLDNIGKLDEEVTINSVVVVVVDGSLVGVGSLVVVVVVDSSLVGVGSLVVVVISHEAILLVGELLVDN